MSWLPYSDRVVKDDKLSDNQMVSFSICIYIAAILSLLALAFVCKNIYSVLCKQRRYMVPPLTAFYVLALILAILRFLSAIFSFADAYKVMPFYLVGPPTIKCAIGIDQAWIMTELCLRIKCSLYCMQSQRDQLSLEKVK